MAKLRVEGVEEIEITDPQRLCDHRPLTPAEETLIEAVKVAKELEAKVEAALAAMVSAYEND